MNFYRETPKTSIYPMLRKRFTQDELDIAKPELHELLHQCNSFDELHNKLLMIIKRKTDLAKLAADNRGNLVGA